jgi:FkbH-like protein
VKSFVDHIEAFRNRTAPPHGQSCRIAVLNGATLTKFDEILKVILWENNINPEIYLSPYAQHLSAVSDTGGELYRFNPGLVFFHTDVCDLIGEKALTPYGAADIQDYIEENFERIERLLIHFLSNCAATVVFSNYSVPAYSPLGIHEFGKDGKYFRALRKINEQLVLLTERFPQLKIFDFDGFASAIGKNRVTEPKLYYQGDIRIHPDLLPALAREYSKYVLLKLGKGRKAVILDLDNTLWGGVAAEEGIENILLSPGGIGKAYYDFQKQLAALRDNGVILAIASRNNEKDIWEIFEKHPFMVLKKEHFAAYRINWNDKAQSVRELARELSLGFESFVFLDDDPVNREQVRLELPDVFTPDLPVDPVFYPSITQELPPFGTLDFTKEDFDRNKMYTAEKERNRFAESVSKDEYLSSLSLHVKVSSVSAADISRVAQLTQKTNQFNMTTKRYGTSEIENITMSGGIAVAAYVSDRFGDSGLTGAAIAVLIADGTWEIDTFLLSCRVLGRRVEDVLLRSLLRRIKEKGGRRVSAKIIKTARNVPALGFYKRMGFALQYSDEDTEGYFSESLESSCPEYITVEDEP